MGDSSNAVTALMYRSRRALYEYVRRQSHPVSREEAATAQRISRSLAAFHLDKLVDAGLLLARYESPPGSPRGRGRAPKVYEPARDDLAVTIPERRYLLMAEILADLGFEPADEGDRILLHNCPFHALAAHQTALVCGLNHAFLTGLVDGLGVTDRRARLAPRPDACCVELV